MHNEQMIDKETKEEMPQPEHAEQQEIVEVEQPVAVVQPVKNIPVKEKKTMLSLDDRMTEFRDMMLERGVGYNNCYRASDILRCCDFA